MTSFEQLCGNVSKVSALDGKLTKMTESYEAAMKSIMLLKFQ